MILLFLWLQVELLSEPKIAIKQHKIFYFAQRADGIISSSRFSGWVSIIFYLQEKTKQNTTATDVWSTLL